MFPRLLIAIGVSVGLALAVENTPLEQAKHLYHTTKYEQAIQLLKNQADPESLLVVGQSWFMLGEFKKSSEVFEKAVAAAPRMSDAHLWLGRAWGRRAETSNPLFAPKYASRARQSFERAVELKPDNILALNDLFEYYMEAPGFLGGGKDKASAVAAKIASLDRAEGHYVNARLAEDKKDVTTAEQQLRRAVEAAPTQVGRVLDLAKFLAKHGRIPESEAEFQHAEKIAPNSPKVLFERASIYIQMKRNVEQAKLMLKRYMEAPLTPDDPPRAEAEKLLKMAGS